MIFDANNIFSGSIVGAVVTGQTVTGTGVTVTSTNVLDLQTARDIGKGEALLIPIEVTVAASGGTSVQFQLVEADDAAISTNVTVLSATSAVPIANLTLGTRLELKVGKVEPYVARRYLALQYVLVGAVAAGAYFAAIQRGMSDIQVSYPSGFTVL